MKNIGKNKYATATESGTDAGIPCLISIVGEGKDSIAKSLKREIMHLQPGTLPLERGTTQGGYIDDSNIDATVIDVSDSKSQIQARFGVFFNEIVGGCSCGDDPVVHNAYCEFIVMIDKTTGEAQFTVITE